MSPQTTTPLTDETLEVLEAVVSHLHHAARGVWAALDQGGVTLDLQYLGLGVCLAQGNAAALLPDDHDFTQAEPPAETAPVQLLRSAEQLLRRLPPDAAPGLSGLVVKVCDLVRENADHGH